MKQFLDRGLKEAGGDLIVISEPDNTFQPRDTLKFLAYADEFDYMIGTRTTRTLIWAGANMGLFLKWGNRAVAKLALIAEALAAIGGVPARATTRSVGGHVRDSPWSDDRPRRSV